MIGSSLFFLASMPRHRVMTNAIKTAQLSDEKEFSKTWDEKADDLWRRASKWKKKTIRSNVHRENGRKIISERGRGGKIEDWKSNFNLFLDFCF